MAWPPPGTPGNNQAVYNAALNGCLAGIFANAGFIVVGEGPGGAPPAVPDGVTDDYAPYVFLATQWAAAVDKAVPTNPQISTGQGGTSVVASAGANVATQDAFITLVSDLSYGYWVNKQGSLYQLNANGTPHTPNSTDYTAQALAIAAIVAQALVAYAANGSNT